MQYRNDRNDRPVSLLGFGCMRWQRSGLGIELAAAEEQVMRAIELGVNYFDTAYIYPGSEDALGRILERNDVRGRVSIATKLPQYLIKGRGAIDRYFDEQLRRLRTDHVDYYLMEGKCALFKTFADVDAFPLCIRSNDVDEIVRTVQLLAGSFGGVNLEDISAPRCFEIERRLKESCDIPVFHDDQHGTAVVTCAALINACKLTGREISSLKVVFSGAGAAGISIAKLMAVTLSETACGVRLLITSERGSAPARRKARSASYSQLVPGNTGMITRGLAILPATVW